jgi:hypothetical protein
MMNQLQANYKTAATNYDNHADTWDWDADPDGGIEQDDALYTALKNAETELIDWAFGKTRVVNYSELTIITERYNNRNTNPSEWLQIADRVIDLALRLA